MEREVCLPTNPFTKAAGYATSREAALKVFLEHPGVGLDTNDLERAIRPIAVGRKNWLFCWTEIGRQEPRQMLLQAIGARLLLQFDCDARTENNDASGEYRDGKPDPGTIKSLQEWVLLTVASTECHANKERTDGTNGDAEVLKNNQCVHLRPYPSCSGTNDDLW